MVPDLSLPSQLQMECDRRAAARLPLEQLAVRTDELIQSWYHQQDLINRLLGRVRHLEVKLALSGAQPLGEPTAEHRRWAAELLSSTPAEEIS